ncbi:unnamed protein product [Cyclocybe aegerita]|uniref:Uncharacterized protein n=1 Tax=Cyclocybe aegerita TaxID=1973307 RepID=A0A8S0VUW3_CYCAE|nr:unnamed protein product [Cyclocybe aegerita]
MMNDTAVETQPSAGGSVPQKRPRDVKDEDQTNTSEPSSKRANVAAPVVAAVTPATVLVAVSAAVLPAVLVAAPAPAPATTPAPATNPSAVAIATPLTPASTAPQPATAAAPASPQTTPARRTAPPGVIIDKDYFFPDGNWVFRVANTLFKLPRFLLMRGSPKLHTANMFNLSPGRTLESITESDILVVNESLEDFRALCWGLTATKCSINGLKRLIILYQKKPTDQLLGLVYCEWTSRLKANSTLSTKEALDFAESLKLQRFQGQIYYAELTRTKVNQKLGSTAHVMPPNNFNDKQMLCFYRGFWSLSHYWAGIRTPPEREKHSDYCARAWESMWDSPSEDGGPIFHRWGSSQSLAERLLTYRRVQERHGHAIVRTSNMRRGCEKIYFNLLPITSSVKTEC